MDEVKKEFETKTFNVDGLGEITRSANGDFGMTQKELNKFFANNGIPEYTELKEKEAEAIDKLTVAGAQFLGEHVKADHRDCELKAGLGNGRIIIGVKERTENKNPRNGDIIEKFGVVTVKFQHKVPKKLAEDGGVLDTLSKEIEASFKALNK